MSVYGDIAIRAWELVVNNKVWPSVAWEKALSERYADPAMLANARKHTCPKGAFLGLCEDGYVKQISRGQYSRSLKSKGYAMKAAVLVLNDGSLAMEQGELESQVFGSRRPNDEVNVVLALFHKGLLQKPA